MSKNNLTERDNMSKLEKIISIISILVVLGCLFVQIKNGDLSTAVLSLALLGALIQIYLLRKLNG